MVPSELKKIIFGPDEQKYDDEAIQRAINHHKMFITKQSEENGDDKENISLKLPKLPGNTVSNFFPQMAKDISLPYIKLANKLCNCTSVPSMPDAWQMKEGWIKYNQDGSYERVDYPAESALIFDVETLVKEGGRPVLAVALSPSNWYGWCSPYLVDSDYYYGSKRRLSDLIPIETSSTTDLSNYYSTLPRLVVGHNVAFDRSYIKEEYLLQGTKTRFIDTMSLHIACSGFTGDQKIAFRQKSIVEDEKEAELWMSLGTTNSLQDVYAYHCGGKPLSKDMRKIFVTGSVNDVRDCFDDLMKYCADDVMATFHVFCKLFNLYTSRFPSVITFSGMLEMGSSYLPVNDNWQYFLNQSQNKFFEYEKKIKRLLLEAANSAVTNKHQSANCPWTWNLDWTTVSYKSKKTSKMLVTHDTIPELFSSKKKSSANFLNDYPRWYRSLCVSPSANSNTSFAASSLSLSQRIVPKLLKLSFYGCPLYYHSVYGWGFLVPALESSQTSSFDSMFPYPSKFALFNILKYMWRQFETAHANQCFTFKFINDIVTIGANALDDVDLRDETYFKLSLWFTRHMGMTYRQRIQLDSKLEGIPPSWNFCIFSRQDCSTRKINVILSKENVDKLHRGELVSEFAPESTDLLIWATTLTYWRNNLDRIRSQYVVWLNQTEIPVSTVKNSFGAILPRVVVSGTVTRRAVEPTWLTASNSRSDRIGSELKAMIQTPTNYHFVGADVDLQELWIASILGDAYFSGIHGSTAFSWMLHQGSKASGSDLHSRTAQIIGLTRSQAKIFNFSRIYGAGVNSAAAMMMNCDAHLSNKEALLKATHLYKQTKGKRINTSTRCYWTDGSESDVFNVMESIAYSNTPRTPVLRGLISKALTPAAVGNKYSRSRLNWVIQSSAVDFLHLLLTATCWLMSNAGINGRFSLSIHDELRIIVQSSQRYEMALALQTAHILTRCAFSQALGMQDLPMSVAFFSSVEIDQCIRKEVNDHCFTPSNPLGLCKGYNIKDGESLDMQAIIDKIKCIKN